MAKYFTPAWLDGISGKIDNVVFAVKKRILPVRGLEAAGWMRRFVYALAGGAKPTNIKAGFTVVTNDWTAISGTDQVTWDDIAKVLSSTLGYDLTGRNVHSSYYMTKHTHGLGVEMYPATLSAGAGADYTNRASRQFTSFIV
ncbi:MAG: hypothetical protein IEMM0008_1570 [bacterium]|nr:MAG: hypothetical protein IEMM0008_1570 [bacterium]